MRDICRTAPFISRHLTQGYGNISSEDLKNPKHNLQVWQSVQTNSRNMWSVFWVPGVNFLLSPHVTTFVFVWGTKSSVCFGYHRVSCVCLSSCNQCWTFIWITYANYIKMNGEELLTESLICAKSFMFI